MKVKLQLLIFKVNNLSQNFPSENSDNSYVDVFAVTEEMDKEFSLYRWTQI